MGTVAAMSALRQVNENMRWAKWLQGRCKLTFVPSAPLGLKLDGLTVSRVLSESQAAEHGVSLGWDIEMVAGRTVTNSKELKAALQAAMDSVRSFHITFMTRSAAVSPRKAPAKAPSSAPARIRAQTCSICLEECGGNDTAVLRCGHAFH